ncbi:MAG: hypothetical protein VXY27_05240, partial [Thermoproteota archaeon]|nr:hypothetical protein [Thermoproteota archaeon]
LLNFSDERSVVIVPSRHFDGTNALLRTPIDSMKPRYDEGSYRFQVESAKNYDVKISVGLIYRLMLDIDHLEDLDFVLKQNIKPELCEKIEKDVFKTEKPWQWKDVGNVKINKLGKVKHLITRIQDQDLKNLTPEKENV